MPAKRRLSAIMFTDIQGYTKLMQKSESTAVQMRTKHRVTFEPITEQHGGEIIQYYGDGTLSIFDSTVSAVRCAYELQKEFLTEPAIPVRIGIHTGDILIDEQDIIGDSVNLASRIESLGQPGCILFSEKVAEEIKNQDDLPVIHVGVFHLKNDDHPRNIYALNLPGLTIPTKEQIVGKQEIKPVSSRSFIKTRELKRRQKVLLGFAAIIPIILLMAGYFFFSKEPLPDKSIAVLPFIDYSPTGDQEWFCDGTTEQIIINLAGYKDLKVIARTSSMKFKNSDKTVPEIGKELNVKHILEGSIRKSPNKIRITAQLINVDDGFHKWEKDFDYEIKDFFQIQDDVSHAIAEILKIEVDGKNKNKIVSPGKTENLDAFHTYQLAKYHSDQYISWASSDFNTGLNLFDEVIQLDSNFLDAYIGKAHLLLSVAWLRAVNPDSLKPQIKSLISQAELINPSSGLLHGIKGRFYNIYDFDFEKAEASYKKAIEFAPGYDLNYSHYAWLKSVTGDFDTAKELIRKAIELNPLSPGSRSILAEIYATEGTIDTAIILFNKNLQLHPNDRYSTFALAAWTGLFNNNYNEVIETIKNIPSHQEYGFAIAYFSAMTGDTTYARSILDNHLAYHQNHPYAWTWPIAVIYTGLGEYEKAIDMLELTPVDMMYTMPWFKPLRTHSRFLKLLKECGFDPSSFPN